MYGNECISRSPLAFYNLPPIVSCPSSQGVKTEVVNDEKHEPLCTNTYVQSWEQMHRLARAVAAEALGALRNSPELSQADAIGAGCCHHAEAFDALRLLAAFQCGALGPKVGA